MRVAPAPRRPSRRPSPHSFGPSDLTIRFRWTRGRRPRVPRGDARHAQVDHRPQWRREKTTFFNLLQRPVPAERGPDRVRGPRHHDLSAAARTRLGIGRSFQLTNVFPTLSVLENVRLAVQARRGLGLRRLEGLPELPDLEDRAYALLRRRVLGEQVGRARPAPSPMARSASSRSASCSPSSPRSSSWTSPPPGCSSRRSGRSSP